ncbi:MAG: RNA methyltransferase [Ruminococcaceae bacterium]|nr:RNA methyltransferase [Oscillospiraceae bacterium]
MNEIIEIHDISDPTLDAYARLTEHQLRNRLEPEKGIFIAESTTVIMLALDAGYRPTSFLMERKHICGSAAAILERCPDVPVYTADDAVLASLTGFALSRGVLAVMRRPMLPTVEEICADARRIAVLENIVDATNVGAIVRSAAALGVDALLLTPSCCDPLIRRAARVSMGTVFQIPWTYIGQTPADWPHVGIDRLHALGFRTAALALTDRSVPIDHPALKKEERLALILGTEGTGLTDETIRCADYTVKIPMFHRVDSLNVAAAGAVAFWETRVRQAD